MKNRELYKIIVKSSQRNVTATDGDPTAQPPTLAASKPDSSQVSVCVRKPDNRGVRSKLDNQWLERLKKHNDLSHF